MRTVIFYAAVAVVLSVIVAAAAAYFLGVITLTLSEENSSAFLGNLLLNVVAELLGFAFGILLAIRIASKFANDKLIVLAPRFVKLIAQLRADKRISDHAARDCVICAVGVISEDRLSKKKKFLNRSDAKGEEHCLVCDLKVETNYSLKGSPSCLHCNLPGNIWSDKELLEITNQMILNEREKAQNKNGA